MFYEQIPVLSVQQRSITVGCLIQEQELPEKIFTAQRTNTAKLRSSALKERAKKSDQCNRLILSAT